MRFPSDVALLHSSSFALKSSKEAHMNHGRPGNSDSMMREYATKVVLVIVFLSALVAFVVFFGPDRLLQTVQSWNVLDLSLLALATYRLGHLVAYDRVMEPFRQPFARTVPDSSGAGDTVEAREGRGIRHALGQLVSCPICSGTWICAMLVYALALLPGPTRIFLWMTAAIGLAELLNALSEALCWRGELSRAQTGAINRRRDAQTGQSENEKAKN